MRAPYRSLLLVPALVVTTAACADSGPESEVSFVTPATAADVADVYDSLGTCHDSTLTRELGPRTQPYATTLWTTPDDAPGAMVRVRGADGKWSSALTVNELGLSGIASDIHSTSPDDPCLAVDRLFSPHTPEGSKRSEYLHALFYVNEGVHPYAAFPAGGVESRRADAPVALVSYLNAVSAERELLDDGVVFRDVIAQELPLYMSCDKPFQVQTETLFVSDSEVAKLDRALCDDGTVGSDGKLSYRCVAERAMNVEGNTCKFVVDGSSLTMDGAAHPVAFGGTITTKGSGASLAYRIHVDRFSTVR